MKLLFSTVTLLLAVFAVPVLANDCQPITRAQEVMTCFERAWNARDVEAIATLLAENFIAEEYKDGHRSVVNDRAGTLDQYGKILKGAQSSVLTVSAARIISLVDDQVWRIEVSTSNELQFKGEPSVTVETHGFMIVERDPADRSIKLASWGNVF